MAEVLKTLFGVSTIENQSEWPNNPLSPAIGSEVQIELPSRLDPSKIIVA